MTFSLVTWLRVTKHFAFAWTNKCTLWPKSMWIHLFSRQNLTTGRFPFLQAARNVSSSRELSSLPTSSSVCCPSIVSDRSLFTLFSFLVCFTDSRGRVASIPRGVYRLTWGSRTGRVRGLDWIEATPEVQATVTDWDASSRCKTLRPVYSTSLQTDPLFPLQRHLL